MASKQPTVNLDWTRDPPPHNLTPYQQFIRKIDWSKTDLGPIQQWSRELRHIVRLLMSETCPVILYWGRSYTIIYNEAYIPLVGDKHPHLQGMNAPDAFPDFWEYFDHIISEQRLTGETRAGDAQMLLMNRHGFLEETYFDWKLIPIIGENGDMVGSYGRPAESTKDVINSRRAACVQDLTHCISNATCYDDLWTEAVKTLAQNDKDLPMAMMYTLESQQSNSSLIMRPGSRYKLAASFGMLEDHSCIQSSVDVQTDSNGLADILRKTIKAESAITVSLTEAGLGRLVDDNKWRGFGVPVENLLFVPVQAHGQIALVMVFGLSPRQRLTNEYLEFCKIIGAVISAQLSRLVLAEEVKRRDRLAQNALFEFERGDMKFSRFAERSPIGLSLTDKSGKVIYANDAWYSFCGLTPTTAEFATWVDTVYEEDLPIIDDWWNKITKHKQSGTFQIRCKVPFTSGEKHLPYRTGIVAAYPDLDVDGNVVTVMGLVTDISELKWNEEQLRLRQREIEKSEANYRDFAEHAPIGVIRTDSEGYVQFANNTWRSFYDFGPDHQFTEPWPWLAALNRDDVEPAKQFFTDILRKGIERNIEVRLQKRPSSMEDNRTKFTEFWLLATGYAEYNNDGSVSSMVFWVTDISNQKAAEHVLTGKMEEAIRLKNTQERFVDMISHEIRNPLSAILHCGEEIVDSMKNCLSSLESNERNVASTTGKRTSTEIKGNIDSALDAANTILYCTQHQKQIVDDVLTLSKLDADLMVVSPIPVQPAEIVRPALKIFEPELKASAIELVLDIKSSLQELKIDWILLDSNRLLQILINLVTNAIKFTRNSASRKIVISLDARTDKPPRQDQGVHYVPRRDIKESGTVSVIENSTDLASNIEDLYLCFSVADTGKGLTESERTTLFNRFTQASPKTHIEYGGSGLGLFISRQITEMLGGEIGVGSEPGKGATFAFYVRTRRAKPPQRASLTVEEVSAYSKPSLPPTMKHQVNGHILQPAQDSKTPTQKPTLPKSDPSTETRRVLVVEDNLVNQKVLCKQLRNRGFHVEAANHGREALDALEKVNRNHHHDGNSNNVDPSKRFDVILCDIEMPIMDGIECVTEIRRLEGDGRFPGHIPIIGVTANVRSKQVNAALEVGMDGVTTKPYRLDELIAHIDRVSAVGMSDETST